MNNNMAEIVEIRDLKGKRCLLSLSYSPFRPSGGGQPGDSGMLEGEDLICEVRDCLAIEGKTFLDVRLVKGTPSIGMKVKTQVDEERHKLLSRMHTGEHVLSKILETVFDGLSVNKVNIAEEESTIYLSYNGELDWENLFEAEEKANEIIRKDLPVYIESVPKEKAEKMDDLKINLSRIKDATVRVVVIPGFDLIACSGSHVKRTSEIGKILVTGFNGSPPNWSVSFTVHSERYLQNYARTARKLIRRIGCPLDKLEAVYLSLQDDKKDLLNVIDKARKYINIPWEKETFCDIDFHYVFMEEALIDVCVPNVKKTVLEHPNSVVLCIFKNPSKNVARFIMARGDSCKINVKDFLKSNPVLETKGGGAESWVQGITKCLSFETWKESLKEYCLKR